MTTAQILAAARDLMLLEHGPECPDHADWVDLAALLAQAETTATPGDTDIAMRIANTYLNAEQNTETSMKLLVELDSGETVSLNTCQFVLFEACGCPSGVVKAGGSYSPVHTEEDAWAELYPTRRERDKGKRGRRMVLMTHDRYVAEVSPQMLAGCSHGAESIPGQVAIDV